MIIETSGLKGLKSDLEHLDEVTTKLGFVRWQWEYYRATYDLKIIDPTTNAEYFLRTNARVELGKLEAKDAILVIEDSYIGITTFPHGLDYELPVPEPILTIAKQALTKLTQQLSL
jgi:hypothetical protein